MKRRTAVGDAGQRKAWAAVHVLKPSRERPGAAHHFMLLLHLAHFLGVFLVHLLQFSHHTFAAFTQSLLVIDELHDTSVRAQTARSPRGGSGPSPCFPT